jgi:LuxR family quorum-sensing system transcriptional regulator CciR
MPNHFDFAQTIADLLGAKSEGDLHSTLEKATFDLGFSQFALGHHVDLAIAPSDAIRLTNYSIGWVERSFGEGYFADDPVHRASMRTAAGFLWTDISKFTDLLPRHHEILAAARSYGLGEGYTVPVHVPGEYQGTCSFAARSLDRLRFNALPIANMIGIWAFEAARKIMRARRTLNGQEVSTPRLTDRQRDSLVLLARGKPDFEIGMLLGISERTAHEHVEKVRKVYGNAQRPLLVARALFDGQISFGDVFRR